MGSQGFFGSSTSGSGVAYSQREETVSRVAVAGQQGFFLPFGVWSRADDILSVEVNGTPITPGFGWTAMRRQRGSWPQPSTDDVCQGVWLSAPSSGGDVVRITFRTRRLLDITPPVLGLLPSSNEKIVDTGGANLKFPAIYLGPTAQLPNQLIVRKSAGLCVEYWRWTKHNALFRGASIYPLMQQRHGRHWSPFFRSAVATESGDELVDPRLEGWIRYTRPYGVKFRACYYDPSTGARTELGTQTLKASGRDDRTAAGVGHLADCLWVVG